jgi:hypothetical protein
MMRRVTISVVRTPFVGPAFDVPRDAFAFFGEGFGACAGAGFPGGGAASAFVPDWTAYSTSGRTNRPFDLIHR